MRELIREALVFCATISLAPLLLYMIGSLLIALLQALTSIQDQTTAYVVRFLITIVLFVCGGPWMCERLLQIMQRCLFMISIAGQA